MRDPLGEEPASRPVPPRALIFSLLALAVPVVGMVAMPDALGEDAGVLLWLTALVPPFLLTYYRGWQGSSLGLAGGMAALALAHLLVEVLELGAPNYTFLFWITGTFIGVCVGAGVLAEVLKRERRNAEEMALTDPLTGLANRRHAGIFLDAAFSAALRGQPVAVVLFDLDDFKEVNDRQGHRAGDEVLMRLAAILSEATRRMDLSVRWGGEEFLSVLSDCEVEGAIAFTERVQEKLREEVFSWGGVTISAGIAEHVPGMGSPELLVATADRALYQAKRAGKDCWRVAGGPEAEPGAEEAAVPDPASWRGSGHGRGIRLPPTGVAGAVGPLPALAGDEEGDGHSGEIPGGWERILLVDDSYAAREGLAGILRRLGYTVVTAPDGKSALATARSLSSVDLVVTDLIMPEMSGFTLGERLEEEMGPSRILYMSGYVQGEVSWKGAPGTVVDFLEKPMTASTLARKVRELLDRPASDVAVRSSVP